MQENEIIMLLIGVCILFFILGNRSRLNSLPSSKLLIMGFFVILSGWFLTVLEGFFWKGVLNILEHICYAGSSVLVALWCWRVFGRQEEDK